jgi:hypothetical protein
MSEMTLYGNREDVLALSQRLQATIPGGRRLSQEEALSLAQISVAHGLDPFNGEAWIIPGSGLMVGIKGLRKAARRIAKEEDGVFWTDFVRVTPETFDEPENSVVYECRLRDTITTQAWAKSINILTTSGVPYKEAIEFVGPTPVKVGIGIAKPDEKSKMLIHQRAKKRAEADALKQRYDVALNAEFSEEEPQMIDATFEDNGKEKPFDEEMILAELGYEPTTTEEKPEIVEAEMVSEEELQQAELPVSNGNIYEAIVEAKLSENVHAARTTLQNYCRTGYDTEKKAIAWFTLYRAWRDSDKTPQEAAEKANKGEKPK